MNKVVVLGAGSFGLTLANLLAEKEENEVSVFAVPDEVDNLNETHMPLAKYLGEGSKINKSIVASSDLQGLVDSNDYVVVALPTQVIRGVLSSVEFKSPKFFINASKGIEIFANKEKTEYSGKTISEVINECVPANKVAANVTISGASYASEIYQKNVTLLTCASTKNGKTNEAAITKTISMLNTPYLQFRKGKNQREVELGGALKNIIAIGSGMVGGHYGEHAENSRSIIIMDGFREIVKLIAHMTDRDEADVMRSMMQPHGIGDLMLTSYSNESRNYRFGENLGKGYSNDDAKDKVVTTIEGAYTVQIAREIIKNELDIEQFPIIDGIYSVIYENKPVKEFVNEILGKNKNIEPKK